MAKVVKRSVGIQKSYNFQTYRIESEIEFTEEESKNDALIQELTRAEEAKVRKEVLTMIRIDYPNYMKTSESKKTLDEELKK